MQVSRREFGLGLASLGAAALAAGPLRAATPRPAMLDTIVLGAGMSGLNTALLLEQQGQRVAVIEARQRVGGRVHTLFDQPGHPEMGFNSMADGYGRGLDAAARAGVEMLNVAPRYAAGPPQLLYIGSQRFTREDWARSPLNPFPDALKPTMPWEMVGKLLAQDNPLKNWLEWYEPNSAPLDVPLHDLLAARGLSDPAIRLAVDTSPYHGTNSWDVSAIMLEYNDGFTRSVAAAGPRSLAVKEGNQRLPEALARQLKGDLLLGKEVVAIASDSDAATVTCADGSTFRAARVVCSLPLAVLRRVKIVPGLTGLQAKAVAAIQYQRISTAFFTVSQPFWEKDGLAPGMWTDGMLGTVMPQKFGRTEQEITGLSIQARGELSRYWDMLGPETALRRIAATLETLRPAAKGAVRAAAYHSWSMDPFSGGAWAYYGPGQATTLPAALVAPAGRIHFCGEHTAKSARGLEGALESSERVVLELLS